MSEKRRYGYRVEPHDVDFMRRATVKSMGDYILHVAGEDADRHGFGTRDLAKDNISWVLSRMAYEIYRLPTEYEKFEVTTWVNEITRISTQRNFDIIAADGTPIGAATTLWAAIDMNTRKPVNLGEIALYANMKQDFPVPIERTTRLATPAEVAVEHDFKVVYSDIDFNRHTHSMNYLRWAVDMLPIEQLETDRRVRVDVNFIKESHFGEPLSIVGNGKEPYCFEIRNAEQAVCRISIGFSPSGD